MTPPAHCLLEDGGLLLLGRTGHFLLGVRTQPGVSIFLHSEDFQTIYNRFFSLRSPFLLRVENRQRPCLLP
jgi:hypothetical protein